MQRPVGVKVRDSKRQDGRKGGGIIPRIGGWDAPSQAAITTMAQTPPYSARKENQNYALISGGGCRAQEGLDRVEGSVENWRPEQAAEEEMDGRISGSPLNNSGNSGAGLQQPLPTTADPTTQGSSPIARCE